MNLLECVCTGTAGLTGGVLSHPLLRGGLRGSNFVSLKGGSCLTSFRYFSASRAFKVHYPSIDICTAILHRKVVQAKSRLAETNCASQFARWLHEHSPMIPRELHAHIYPEVPQRTYSLVGPEILREEASTSAAISKSSAQL